MSSKTKIVVLKSKELIYTGIFILLGILLIVLLIYMFSPKKDTKNKQIITTETATTTESLETFSGYTPGVYTSELNLGGSTLLLSVSVDGDRVTGVAIDNMDETLTAMYPLVQPSLDEINNQIGMVSSIKDITYSSDNKYTTILILDAIDDALKDASR
ncbi:MAG: hypothetical protein E7257_07905 [Lachnospiraceae bacterium]|nr:hypothetical protein [Lachnospiraceae bacterium]MBQ9934401.1 hypothetical protein [Lachnospiraceae bacterium]